MLEITWELDSERKVWKLLIDGELFQEVPKGLYRKAPKIPPCNSKEQFEKTWAGIEHKRAWYYAIRALARKNFSSKEMKQRMIDRGISSETAKNIVEECIEAGYINDSMWLEGKINRMIQKGWAPKRMIYWLVSSGVEREEAEKGVVRLVTTERLHEMIGRLLKTRFKKYSLGNSKERQKVVNNLMREGFEYSQLNLALIEPDDVRNSC